MAAIRFVYTNKAGALTKSVKLDVSEDPTLQIQVKNLAGKDVVRISLSEVEAQNLVNELYNAKYGETKYE